MSTCWWPPLFVLSIFCGAGSTIALPGASGVKLSGDIAYKRVIRAKEVVSRTVEIACLGGPFGEPSDFKRLKTCLNANRRL